MAIFSRTSNLWILSLKLLLISSGALSTALVLKLSFPVITESLLSTAPVLWTSLRSWLTPPYLYVVINGIIIIIAASSRFQKAFDEQREPVKAQADVRQDFAVSAEYEDDVVVKKSADEVRSVIGDLQDYGDEVLMKDPVKDEPEAMVSATTVEGNTESLLFAGSNEEEKDDLVVSSSKWTLNRMDSTETLSEYSFASEKPLVSARFSHRRNVTVSPEAGKLLRVAKPKRQDTLESTWKKITEGRSMPLARHSKKSDTWEIHGHHQSAAPLEKMKKADTFIKKDPSLGQEELNRRVEAFIKKFNEDMRLQRQESQNQYMETINRGVH